MVIRARWFSDRYGFEGDVGEVIAIVIFWGDEEVLCLSFLWFFRNNLIYNVDFQLLTIWHSLIAKL